MKKILFALFATVFAFSFSACSDDDEPSAPETQISIQCNGKEVQNNDVVQYNAAPNFLGEIEAGHNTEPSFISNGGKKLEVTITIPENSVNYFQWCGITSECLNYKEAGSFTRVKENMTAKESMELHAYFKDGVFTSCKVKVDVKVDGKQERTFFLEYIYAEQK